MSMWAGTCQLATETQTRDKRGVVSTSLAFRDVPCNVYSISAAGIKPQAVIELRACAYRGETLVKFNGALLAVERAERSPDNVRLTLVERVGDREQG